MGPRKARPRPPLLPKKLEQEVHRKYANAGLSPRWWQALARDIRHCLRCGGTLEWRFVKVEGKKRFVCDACQIIAYQNPKIVGATLPIRKGRVYLLRRAIEPAYGLWSHPAGYMEMGETVEEAALRETWEEIRVKVRIAGPPRIYSYPDAAIVTVVYPAEVLGREPRPGVESLEVRAFRPEEIPWKQLAFRSTFHTLRDWVRAL